MCSCDSLKVTTDYNTEICVSCGIEQPVGITQEFVYMPGANLLRSYSRNERWRNLIRKITGYHCGPPPRDPVWKYLESHKPFETPKNIITCLRKSKLVNKHYQNIFIFTKIFSPTYVMPKYNPEVSKRLESYFDFVYTLWNRHFGKRPFFSYNWLIEQSLELFNYTEYKPYVKLLVCSKRRRKYEALMFKLYGIHLELLDYKPQHARSQCAKLSSLNLQSQLSALSHLLGLPLVARKSD